MARCTVLAQLRHPGALICRTTQFAETARESLNHLGQSSVIVFKSSPSKPAHDAESWVMLVRDLLDESLDDGDFIILIARLRKSRPSR